MKNKIARLLQEQQSEWARGYDECEWRAARWRPWGQLLPKHRQRFEADAQAILDLVLGVEADDE